MMILVDSHCHLDRLDLTPYQGQLALALAAAQEQGVGHILSVSVTLDDFPQLQAIADNHSAVSLSVGVHPTEEITHEPDVKQLIALAQQAKVVAIGETGLDYYYENTNVALQQQRFRQHIQAAHAVAKPLIIHTRAASADTLRIMKEEQADQVRGVMHCFTESWEVAEQAMALGFYISLSGIVTFKNAVALQQIAKQIPLERLLIEICRRIYCSITRYNRS
jgi:TatD DNase family protein